MALRPQAANSQPSAPQVTKTAACRTAPGSYAARLARRKAEEEFHLVVADLHNIGLPESPEHLLPVRRQGFSRAAGADWGRR